MPLTQTQIMGMGQHEAEARFHRMTDGEGQGAPEWTTGWDGDGPDGDAASLWSEWLHDLLWPEEFTPGPVRPYYADREAAIAAADAAGFAGPYGANGEDIVKDTLIWALSN